MFGIRELKRHVINQGYEMASLINRINQLENPPKHNIGDVVNGLIISHVIWELSMFGAGYWLYKGVKKGSDKLIEVK